MVRDNIKEYTVTEISASIKETLEDNFGYVKVRGEVSGLSKPASGHVYPVSYTHLTLPTICSV